MPTYVIEREMPGAQDWSQDQIQSASRQSLDALQHLGIQWMHSYVTDDKVYCIYWAPGEDVIQEHADKLGLRFTVPDDLQEVYRSFGIDLPKHNGEPSWTLPMPARLVADGGGIVRAVDADPDYTRRPEADATVAEVAALT